MYAGPPIKHKPQPCRANVGEGNIVHAVPLPIIEVTIDNDKDDAKTLISVSCLPRPGLLRSLNKAFNSLGLKVTRSTMDKSDVGTMEYFLVETVDGGKVTDPQDMDDIVTALRRIAQPRGAEYPRRPHFESGQGDTARLDSLMALSFLEVSCRKRLDSGQGDTARLKELMAHSFLAFFCRLSFESGQWDTARLENLMDTYQKNDVLSIQHSIVEHVEYTMACSRYKFDDFEAYEATALSLRDRLIETWNDTQTYIKEVDPKRVYYLSMEFLMGRSLLNTLYNLDVEKPYSEALHELGYELENIVQNERDAALGNGGLGRLAACFLDSMATLNLPAWGYGIRYTYGMFRQLERLSQHEQDAALGNGGLGLGLLAAWGWGGVWGLGLSLGLKGLGLEPRPGVVSAAWVIWLLAFQTPLPHSTCRRWTIVHGFQKEQPDYWLTFGNPWEIERLNVSYTVGFYGHVSSSGNQDEDGKLKTVHKWSPGEKVTATACDTPIPGFNTRNCINLRLWAARPSKEFDLEAFNTGDYVTAIIGKQQAETLSSVLYPDDRTYKGRELKLKQQHFLVSATLQDVVCRFLDSHKDEWDLFPEKVALQLNDSHPSIGIVELMRLLMDEHGLEWDKSWSIVNKVFAYTNHTIMSEFLEKWPVALVFAYTNHTIKSEFLEKWPVDLMEKLLPRHMQIINNINHNFLKEVQEHCGNDWDRAKGMSIIEDVDNEKYVNMAHLAIDACHTVNGVSAVHTQIIQEELFRDLYVNMAHLAIVACHTVNGVSAIHTQIMQEDLFKSFYEMMPEKFQNKTNGVTQRRWLAFCNPPLRELITRALGDSQWISDFSLVKGLEKYANDPDFHEAWRGAKYKAKVKAAAVVKRLTGVTVSPDAMFDVQVKRVHEYKRQLLNLLGIIHRYDLIKKMTPEERQQVVPRVCIIGGKAAPGYDMAKRIIKMICAVGNVINADPEIGDLLKLVFVPDYNVSLAELKLVFVPDYNVSLAEVLVPALDLSQHISTAGTEASGTSNMKFAMNGSLIIGTMDGANIEIAEEIGEDKMFIFGLTSSEVAAGRVARPQYPPKLPCQLNLCLEEVLAIVAAVRTVRDLDPPVYPCQLDRRLEEVTAARVARAKELPVYPHELDPPVYPRKLDPRLEEVLALVSCGTFGWEDYLMPVVVEVGGRDKYFVGDDFRSYIDAQAKVDATYQQPEKWTSMSIMSTAGCSKFSADRTIAEYAKNIWGVEACKVPEV
eukprot:gene29610-17891_t